MGWDVLCDIADVLAAADGSQAWLQHIFADHTVLVATFPAQAQDEVWGKNHSAITSASFDPAGRATRVEGGFLFSGRHGFSSGIDYADWLICGGMIVEKDGLDGPHFFLVPKSRRRGARRLGHHGARRHRLEDLRRHRQVHSRASFPRRPPVAFRNRSGHRRQQGGGLSRAAVRRHGGGRILGAGGRHGARRVRGMACATPARARRAASPIGAQQGTQILAARSAAEIDAAHALYQTTVRGGMRKLEEGGTESSAERLTGRRNIAFACQLALKAGTRLFNAGGGSALYLKGAMQRQYRNLLGAVAHRGVNWETGGRGLRRRAARAARRAAASPSVLRFFSKPVDLD